MLICLLKNIDKQIFNLIVFEYSFVIEIAKRKELPKYSIKLTVRDIREIDRFITNTAVEGPENSFAGVTKRSTVADSRSARVGVRGFESLLPHQ